MKSNPSAFPTSFERSQEREPEPQLRVRAAGKGSHCCRNVPKYTTTPLQPVPATFEDVQSMSPNFWRLSSFHRILGWKNLRSLTPALLAGMELIFFLVAGRVLHGWLNQDGDTSQGSQDRHFKPWVSFVWDLTFMECSVLWGECPLVPSPVASGTYTPFLSAQQMQSLCFVSPPRSSADGKCTQGWVGLTI